MSAMHMAKTEEGAATWFALNSFEIWKILFSTPRVAKHMEQNTFITLDSATWNTKLQKSFKLFKLLSETAWPWPYLPCPV